MKHINLFIFLFSLFIILNSCTSLSDASKVLRNEKIKSNDEFLIQKKEPLTQPPDFEKIPVPGSAQEKANKTKSIKEILKVNQSDSNKIRSKSSSTEESILKQIKK